MRRLPSILRSHLIEACEDYVIATSPSGRDVVQYSSWGRHRSRRNGTSRSSPANADEAPAGDDWLHEIKYDGYRMHARFDGGKCAASATATAARADPLRPVPPSA